MSKKIIILPGWMHTSKDWSVVVDGLTQADLDARCIDIPGFGVVPALSSQQSFTDTKAYLVEEIQQHTNSETTLVGHSFGGRILVDILNEQSLPHEKIILIGSPNLYRPTLHTQLKRTVTKLLSPLTQHVPEAVRSRVRSGDYKAAVGTNLERLIQETIGYDQTDSVAALLSQTILIWGEHDDAAPLHLAEEMARLMKHVQLDIIAGAGHNLHLEKPELLTAKLIHYATT